MNSSMSSSLPQRSLLSASHGHRLDGKKERPSYVPPEFDFSKAESVRASVDIDEVCWQFLSCVIYVTPLELNNSCCSNPCHSHKMQDEKHARDC